MSVMETAFQLLSEGIAVFPCWQKAKEPAIASWLPYQTTLPSELQVTAWFSANSRNLAIVCGRVSGNLLVIDCDSQEAYDTFVKTYGALIGNCPVVKTSRGYHIYIRTDRPVRSAKRDGIDIKAEGGYVIGPGSVHPDGTVYQVVQGDLAHIPVIDSTLLGLEEAPAAVPATSAAQTTIYKEGNRNDGLYRDACSMRARGLSREAITAALQEVNRVQCDPPLGDTEVAIIIDSAMRRTPRTREPLLIIGVEDILRAPPVTWLVDQLLFDNTLSLLGSYAGRGKSLVAMAIAKSIATGEALFGRYEVKRTGPVLFVDEENSHSDLRDRMLGMGINSDMPLKFISFEGVLVDDEQCFDRLMEAIKEVNPVLVVLDSLVRLHKAKENDASEMSRVMRSMRLIVNEGFGVLILHHHTKGQGDLETRARGSSDIVGAIDVEYALDLRGDDLVLCSVKSRRAPIEPVRLQIVSNLEGLSVQYQGPGSYMKDDVKAAVLDIVKTEGQASFDTIQERILNRGLNVGRNTLRDTIKELTGRGLFVRTGVHNKRFYEAEDDVLK
jgi:hypothetical protein